MLHHEKQVEVTIEKSQDQPKVVVFAVKNSNHGTKDEQKCAKCNKTNHTTKNCHAHLKCSFCSWKGHTLDYCHKKKAAIEDDNNATIIVTDKSSVHS